MSTGFKQNAEMTYVTLREATQENAFLKKPVDLTHPPAFPEVRDSLPQPVWEGHEMELRSYWKAWELAFGNLRVPIPGTGFVSPYIDAAFNGCIFLWDSVFMMMFGKYAERQFHFQGTLDNFYSHQHRDGFICREIEEATGEDRFTRFDPSATGPEVLAWCEWEYYLQFGDRDRLRQVFPPLLAYHRWMAEHHTWPDGTYFSSGWGCGMDNLPRQMPGDSVEFSHGHMVWVDACMQALQTCKLLCQMARELNETVYIEALIDEGRHLERVINEKLWDEDSGFYYDLWRNGRLNHVMHIGAFWALLSGCASPEQANRMISRLQDTSAFMTPHRIPSLARNHPLYSRRGEYWRGSVWAPTNYMVLRGLDRYGQYDLSHEIGLEHLRWVTSVFHHSGTLYENYAPEPEADGHPVQGNHAKDDFVGWTGLVPISVLFEFVFGIKPDASKGRILWDVHLTQSHGVQQYPFGSNGEVTLLCGNRKSPEDMPDITVSSNVPVLLEVRWGGPGTKRSMTISSGK